MQPCAKSFIFEGREQSNVHAVETGNGSAWVGFCRKPSLLLQVHPETGETVPIRFDVEGGLHDLAFDGEWLWVAHASGHLSRVDPDSGEIRSRKVEVSSGQGGPQVADTLIVRRGDRSLSAGHAASAPTIGCRWPPGEPPEPPWAGRPPSGTKPVPKQAL